MKLPAIGDIKMISEWISQAVAITGDSARKLELMEVDRLVRSIRHKFTTGHYSRGCLWEEFENPESRRCVNGWKRLCEFPVQQPLLLFQDTSAFEGFSFPSSESLGRILAETPGFEFYLTNSSVDFVICFNHHDYLVCVGASKEWVKMIPDDVD